MIVETNSVGSASGSAELSSAPSTMATLLAKRQSEIAIGSASGFVQSSTTATATASGAALQTGNSAPVRGVGVGVLGLAGLAAFALV